MPQNIGRILSQIGGEAAAAYPEGLPPGTGNEKNQVFWRQALTNSSSKDTIKAGKPMTSPPVLTVASPA